MFKGKLAHQVLQELSIEYGDIYTLWLGPEPTVIVNNDAIFDAFIKKKNDFAGRPDFFFRTIALVSKDSSDIIFEDWGRPWEVLRRVAHAATRKFAVSPKLPTIEVAVVDEVVDLILSKEGLNKPFNPKDYIYLMVYSIIASMAAGKSYSINDDEFINLKTANDSMLELQPTLVVVEFFPLLRFFPYQNYWKRMIDAANVNLDWCRLQVDQHMSKYQDNNGKTKKLKSEDIVINDFIDSLIAAKIEAEETDNQAANHLTPDNLKNVVQNLFQAGTETTRMTLNWAFLLIANYQDVQRKLRNEINEIIGNEIPNNDHRKKCHYVQAFIAEVMRFSPIVSAGVPHKAIKDSEVKGQVIPKGTTIIANLISQLFDEEIWKDPRKFRPERFIDESSGTFNARMNDSFHPFSVGRRACLGEKLALINLFIEITRFLQKTKGYKIVLKDGEGSVSMEPDPIQNTMYANVEYEIMIVKE